MIRISLLQILWMMTSYSLSRNFQMMSVRWCLLAVATVVACDSISVADVRLPEVISDNMVLQKDIPLPIWGWAAAGKTSP
jgi:hypothetical protein